MSYEAAIRNQSTSLSYILISVADSETGLAPPIHRDVDLEIFVASERISLANRRLQKGCRGMRPDRAWVFSKVERHHWPGVHIAPMIGTVSTSVMGR